VEHEEQADQMERDVKRMEHDSGKVGDHIDEARQDWESKERDPSVPGAQPDSEEEEEPLAGAEVDEKTTSEEGGP
jgi:hypothetical protein